MLRAVKPHPVNSCCEKRMLAHVVLPLLAFHSPPLQSPRPRFGAATYSRTRSPLPQRRVVNCAAVEDASVPDETGDDVASAATGTTTWRDRLPDPPLLAGAVATVGLTAWLRPMFVAQVLYVATGVGVGFGSTKLMRFASSPEARSRVVSFAKNNLNVRAKLRAALLKFDPSLADEEGSTIGLRDLRGPRRGGGRQKPAPPWRRAEPE